MHRTPAKQAQMIEHFRQVADRALERHNANPSEISQRIVMEAREDLRRELNQAALAREGCGARDKEGTTMILSPTLKAIKDEQDRVLDRFRGNVRKMSEKRKKTKLHGAALKAHEKKLGKRSKKRKGEHHKKKKAHHRRRACAFCGHTAVHHAKQGCLHHSGMKFCSCKHRG
jgi:hypothetical protein